MFRQSCRQTNVVGCWAGSATLDDCRVFIGPRPGRTSSYGNRQIVCLDIVQLVGLFKMKPDLAAVKRTWSGFAAACLGRNSESSRFSSAFSP